MMKNPATADKPDQALLDIIVCPLTRSVLEYDHDRRELVSRQSNLAYPVRGGIPVMVPSEARELGFEENRNRKKS